uniref:Uncharacterized protein n=1 Tax=Arundo donax TaxID=35708 RepID=A0A0A9ANZ1_ARUDO
MLEVFLLMYINRVYDLCHLFVSSPLRLTVLMLAGLQFYKHAMFMFCIYCMSNFCQYGSLHPHICRKAQ